MKKIHRARHVVLAAAREHCNYARARGKEVKVQTSRSDLSCTSFFGKLVVHFQSPFRDAPVSAVTSLSLVNDVRLLASLLLLPRHEHTSIYGHASTCALKMTNEPSAASS
jgi:hypothetical protein